MKSILRGVIWVLLVVVVAAAITGFWTRAVIYNSDRFMAVIGPLPEDANVREAAADSIYERIQDGARNRLSGPAKVAATTALGQPAVEQKVTEGIDAVVASEEFNKVWTVALEQAHTNLVALLKGDAENVTLVDGAVMVDLSPLAPLIRKELNDRGVEAFDEILTLDSPLEVKVFQSAGLENAQEYAELFNKALIGIAVLLVALPLILLLISDPKRGGVIGILTATAVGAALVRLGFWPIKWSAINTIKSDPERELAQAIFTATTENLGWACVIAAFIAAILALLIWISRPKTRSAWS